MRTKYPATRRSGFTLIQLMVVLTVISALAVVLMGVVARGRASTQRVQCDTRVKAIAMALDAFRQEQGRYPDVLQELVERKYLTDPTILRCPADPRSNGSYEDYYVLRSGRDSDELPIMVCPLCEQDRDHGIQAFKGRYTKQFATRPATISAATGAMVERPGKVAIAAKAGMMVRGGDSIRTLSGGTAKILFADGSVTEVNSASEVTVLQSFLAGTARAPLYTIIRQKAGDVVYRVNQGSKFDVVTPTATAGALGTVFQIQETTLNNWNLKVLESKVYCSLDDRTEVFTPVSNTPVTSTVGPVTQTNDWVSVGESIVYTAPSPANPTATQDTVTRKKKNRGRGHGSGNSDDD